MSLRCWWDESRITSLSSPSYIIRFLIFFTPSYLIFTTFCFVDGLSALVLATSSFLTVPASIFPVNFSERGLGFWQQGILLCTKWTHFSMNTEGKVEHLTENFGTVQTITGLKSSKFKCVIILFDSVGKVDYTRSLKESKHVLDVKIRKVFTTLSHSHDRFGCTT